MHVSLLLLCQSRLLAELKACGSSRNLARGRSIHEAVIQSGEASHVFVANTLISMYGKCGCLQEARRVFDGMRTQGVISWNALISGYADNGDGETALDLFSQMRREGHVPNERTYLAALKACNEVDKDERREWGRALHLLASTSGCDTETSVGNTLVSMYAKFRTIGDARRVFDNMRQPDVVSWNALIFGYADNGECHTALELFLRIGCAPDASTFVAALKACRELGEREQCSRERGKAVHLLASCNDCDSNAIVSSALLNMYVKCRSMECARMVFERMSPRDLVVWNGLMLGYAENGEGDKSLHLFSRMRREGYTPDVRTFSASLKACIDLAVRNERGHGEKGQQVHMLALRSGEIDTYLESTLVDMYAKCGRMEDARWVFEGMEQIDVVSWTTLILGYADNGKGETALSLFSRMRVECGSLDSRTFVGAIRACTDIAARRESNGFQRGKALHSLATLHGCESSIYVKSVLLDMYVKSGRMEDARRVFEMIVKPDVISWTSLMLGYVENGEAAIALELFARMKREGCVPDSGSFVAALKACAMQGSLEFGKAVHAEICDRRIQVDVVLATCLVDFYSRCGNLLEAEKVFNLHATRDLVAWTALMAGYSRLGDTAGVFHLLERMLDAGISPDHVTFSCILATCSHAGLVEKGKLHFDSITAKYGLKPDAEHYTCMVDMLGRANNLDDAMALLRSMPYNPDVVIWNTLLGACRKWKNVELGKLVFESMTSLDDKIPGAVYVQMANIYGSRERDQAEVQVELSI